MKQRVLPILLSLALCLTLLPGAALAAEETGVIYLDENGDVQTTGDTPVTVLDSSSLVYGLTEEWYVVRGQPPVVEHEPAFVSGDVHLILADGCYLHAKNGIRVPEGSSLTIYAQSTDKQQMGKLTAESNGIGNAYDVAGNITINGGTVTATGGFSGAGIGNGSNCSAAIEIDITGGTVTAYGGRNGAGIGSGSSYYTGTIGINIRGGTVTANGNYDSAGIGHGYNSMGTVNVTISGGTVTAAGGQDNSWEPSGDGIGSTSKEDGSLSGTFTFSTGTNGSAVILAKAGKDDGDVAIRVETDEEKEKWSGVIFEETTGTVYGSPTPKEDFTIPAGYTLPSPRMSP